MKRITGIFLALLIMISTVTVGFSVSSAEGSFEVVFHENQPGANDTIFRTYSSSELNNGSISHFYDIPEWASDEYVFAGWYHNSTYSAISNADNLTPLNFGSNDFSQPNNNSSDNDYHIYAKWIPIGTVETDSEDQYRIGTYRGFELVGTSKREEGIYDANYGQVMPGGLRYIAVLSESLLSQIDAISDQKVVIESDDIDNREEVDVEYGFIGATESNANIFVDHYGANPSTYTMKYSGTNVNGVNTQTAGSADTDYRYVVNLNCTSGTGHVTVGDHANFDDYRIYSFVTIYDGQEEDKYSKLILRAFLRYTDANGYVRVFYNNYQPNGVYGGCSAAFIQPEVFTRSVLRKDFYVNYNENNSNVINQSNGDGTSIVTLDYDTANLRVTVPTVLPVSVDSDNNVTVATTAKIVNSSKGQVDVTNAVLSGNNSWALAAFDTDFTKVPVNTKQYGFKLQGYNVPVNGNAYNSQFDTIAGNASLDLSYDANVAIQSEAIKDAEIGNIVFTVAWHK